MSEAEQTYNAEKAKWVMLYLLNQSAVIDLLRSLATPDDQNG